MDAQTGERLLQWDPIPREANVYLGVGVCRVEERADLADMPLTIILVATRRDASDGAWRLLFQRVRAYRRLPVGVQAGIHLIALRDAHQKRSQPTPAIYEVVRSRWLQEIASTDAHPGAVRHFVIAASYVAYDIAAEWCEVEALGDAEQACVEQ